MQIAEVTGDSADIVRFRDGFIIRRSRSKTSFLAGDRSRYSIDLKSVVDKLRKRGAAPDAKIWLGDTSQKEGEIIGTIQTILDQPFPPLYLKLYHGTSSDRLNHIRKHGLVPVRSEYRVWNSGEDITQRDDAIYLTAVLAQAEYYAMKAVAKAASTKPVVFKVIIKQSQYDSLIPDDDYMEKKPDRASTWQSSLSYYGQVAFVGSIPPEQIRVIALGLGAKQHSQ